MPVDPMTAASLMSAMGGSGGMSTGSPLGAAGQGNTSRAESTSGDVSSTATFGGISFNHGIDWKMIAIAAAAVVLVFFFRGRK